MKSIKEIQKIIGVKQDGIVGPKTRAAAYTAYINSKLNDYDMKTLRLDVNVPPPTDTIPDETPQTDTIPDETPQTKRISFLDVVNASKPDSNNVPFSDKPTYTVPFLNPTSFNKDETPTWEQVLKTGYDKDSNPPETDSSPAETDSEPDRTYKSGIMALLNPIDSPDYMGSKLYLQNERNNYAKAIGNTPVISKVFQGIDYSNDDVKSLLNDAYDDVKTQEAMKKAQTDTQSNTISNVRAMVDQNLQAANQLSGELIEAEKSNRIIQTNMANDADWMKYYKNEMDELKKNYHLDYNNDGRASGNSPATQQYNDAYDNYWKSNENYKTLNASLSDTTAKSNMRQTMLNNATYGAKLLGIDFGMFPNPTVTQQQSNVGQTQTDQSTADSQTPGDGKTQTETGKSGTGGRDPAAHKKTDKSSGWPIDKASDSALFSIATHPVLAGYSSGDMNTWTIDNQHTAVGNSQKIKDYADQLIKGKISQINNTDSLKKAWAAFSKNADYKDLIVAQAKTIHNQLTGDERIEFGLILRKLQTGKN